MGAAGGKRFVTVRQPQTLVVATHYWTRGCALALTEYLKPRAKTLQFIGHPTFTDGKPSVSRLYDKGRLTNSAELPGARGIGRYPRELWRTVHWVSQQPFTYDAFVAGDSLLAIAGLWLRYRRRVRSVILYTVDFVPDRFPNRVVNHIYHALDRFAVGHVNVVWNVTPEIEAARRRRDNDARSAPQIVVPVGANIAQIRRKPVAKADSHRLVFLGHLLEKQGVQLAIEALPLIRRVVPDASLLVIGDGPFLSRLRELAERYGVAASVRFTGALYEDAEIEEHVSSSGVGLAMFTPELANFSRFADPGKIKTYLACGIPVLLTDVPPIARLVQAEGAGRIVAYSAVSLADAVISYSSDPHVMSRSRAAAAKLGATFGWDRVFDDAWDRSSVHLGAKLPI